MDNQGRPVPKIRLNIYSDFISKGGSQIASGITDNNGVFSAIIKVPAFYDSLVVQTDALGFIGEQKVEIHSNTLTCVLGGKNPATYGTSFFSDTSNASSQGSFTSMFSTVIKPLGSYNSLGVPTYLVNPNKIIDASIVSDINAALPEHKSVPQNLPSYMNESNMTQLEFQQDANVTVTFLHEGASFKNVLGY